MIRLSTIRRALLFFLLTASTALAGCGSSTSVSPDEEQAISLVLDVSDATRSEADFAAIFATGHTPAKTERDKYAKFSFAPQGKPTIEGETATLVVAVMDAEDNQIGESTWTAAKEQGTWKLTSAPLP